MTIRLLQGDCREVLATLDAESFDACVTDPPYGLGFMDKVWDTFKGGADMPMRRNAAQDSVNTGATRQRRQARDMRAYQDWCFEWASQTYRVLKPGAHFVVFGGTRTYHRLVCAIEDSGFEVRTMLAWMFGSGFPKGTDKAKIPPEWAGWNTALKPAMEPILLARKPMVGTLAENLLRYGTGALNIDGCRVPTAEDLNGGAYSAERQASASPWGSLHESTGEQFVQPPGRWPANVLHDGSDEVLAAFPEAPGQIADASSASSGRKTQNSYGAMKRGSGAGAARNDAGSAARFYYCAKASKADREEGNTHPTVKPTDLMRYLCRLVTPPGGLVLDPFMGSGSTLKAAELEGFRGVGIEMNPEYLSIAQRRIAADAPLFANVQFTGRRRPFGATAG